MSSVVIAGNTSGSITISAPDVSGSNTLTLPVATDTLVGKATTDTLTNKTLVNPTITDLQTLNTPNTFGFKNRIINGGMVIDQRNAGASVTPADGAYTLDRWRAGLSQASKLSIQQNSGSVTPPSGFKNYLGVVSLSAYALTGSDVFMLQQKIEGYNVSDLMLGTASAASFTVSFWVRSSLTGLFGGSLINSVGDRSYPFSYTISTANTWEQKSITVAGDTSGTWLTTTGTGLELRLSMGSSGAYLGTANVWGAGNYASVTGATSVVGTNGATFYITGVQLEKGSTATSFDFRDYGRELIMCQRYAYGHVSSSQLIGLMFYYSATRMDCVVSFPTTMRTTPSLTATSGTNCYLAYRNGSSDFVNSIAINEVGLNGCTVYNNSEASGTAGDAGWLTTQAASVLFSAEL